MSEEDFIIIESYLEGALPPEQATAVTARATADPLFAKALGERRRLYEHLAADANESVLLENLTTLNDKFFPETAKEATIKPLLTTRRRWLLGMVAAAVLALAIIAGGRLFGPNGSTYEQFAQHEPLALAERGEASVGEAAETAFNEGRYAEAIDRLEAYLQDHGEDQRARLALGIALLERHQDTTAVKIFTDIVASKSPLAPYGNWYLALAAVKQGDNAKALQFLELIPTTDAYLAERVRKLKSTL